MNMKQARKAARGSLRLRAWIRQMAAIGGQRFVGKAARIAEGPRS